MAATLAVIHPSAQQSGSGGLTTGSISGVVLDDRDKPIGGALVVADSLLPSVSPSEGRRDTTTDASGAYQLRGLPPGQYYISVPVWTRTYPIPATISAKPGSFEASPRARVAATMVDGDAGHFMTITGPSNLTAADAHPQMYVTTYFSGALRPADSQAITVGTGTGTADTNIRLTPRRTVRVEGVLIGSSGPVARAAVRLYLDRRELATENPIPTATAFTDGAGRFLFMALAAGAYVADVDRPTPPGDDLRLSATGFPALVMRDYSGGSDLKEYLPETTLTVGESDKADVTLTLRRGASVSGTVIVDRPMLLASGQLIPPFYITLGRTSRGILPAGRSSFRIDDVKPGKYIPHAGPLLEGFSIQAAALNGQDILKTPLDVGWTDVMGITITIGDGKTPPPRSAIDGAPPTVAMGRPSGAGAPPLGPNGLPISVAPGGISGVIRDTNGEPMAGVQVQAVKRLTVSGMPQAVAINQPVITDEQGRYRLTNLPQGVAYVAALGPNGPMMLNGPTRVPPPTTDADGRRMGYVQTFYPGTTMFSKAGTITVGTADFPGVDFTLQRNALQTISGTVSAGSGMTTRPAGSVMLVPASLDDQLNGRNAWRTSVDPQGQFSIADVPPGDYVASILGTNGWGRADVHVTDSGAPPIALTLQPSFSVSGHVEFAGPRPPLTATDIARLDMRLNSVPLAVGTPLLVARVTPEGQFTFTGAPGGSYTIRATAPAPWIVASAVINGRDTIDFPASLTEATSNAVVTLTDRLPAVLGTVRDAAGAIVSEGMAIVFSADPAYWTMLSRRVQVAPINPGGTFSVMVPPGKYFVVAGREITRPASITPALMQSLAARAASFEAVAGQDRTVQVRSGG